MTDTLFAFRAYLVNESNTAGGLVTFPTTPETYAEALRFISLDANEPTRWHGFYCPKQPLIGDMIPTDAHVDELHYLAARFLTLDDMDTDKYLSILERANPTMQPLPVAELINHAENLNAYHFMRGVENDHELCSDILNYEVDGLWEALGQLSEAPRAPQRIIADLLYEALHQLDTERIGQMMREREQGGYGSEGYLAQTGELQSIYRERADIPPSYRIAEAAALIMTEQEPKRSVRGQLKEAREQMEVDIQTKEAREQMEVDIQTKEAREQMEVDIQTPEAKPLSRRAEPERVI